MNDGLPSVNFNTLTIPLYVGIDPTTPDTLYVTVFGQEFIPLETQGAAGLPPIQVLPIYKLSVSEWIVPEITYTLPPSRFFLEESRVEV